MNLYELFEFEKTAGTLFGHLKPRKKLIKRKIKKLTLGKRKKPKNIRKKMKMHGTIGMNYK